MKPLSGIKVVELSAYVAAPVCGRLLADLGASVIKIESLQGDNWRKIGQTVNVTSNDEENPLFDVYNAGKKDIALNLKSDEGKEIFNKLLEDADVFLTNTRIKSLEKLGIDYDSIKTKYPKLIYAVLTGFGEIGPEAENPGFDNVAFWAKPGFLTDMIIKTEKSYPIGAPTGVGDTVCGLSLLSNIMTALYNRERTQKGDYISVSLYNTALWVMCGMIIRAQERYGDPYPKERYICNPLSTCYECADGEWLMITILDYKKYALKFYEIMECPEYYNPEMERSDAEGFLEYRKTVLNVLEEKIKKKTSKEWLKILKENDIVCDRMNHFKDVPDSAQAWENEFVQKYVFRNGEHCVMPCPPLRLKSVGNVFATSAPLLGEHSEEILESLGYTHEQIEDYISKGITKQH